MVLVCHDPPFICLKTFKSASTSIEGYFQRWCLPPEESGRPRVGVAESVTEHGIVGRRGIDNDPEAEWVGHMSAAEVHRRLPRATWNGALRFCSIRNPFARMVSLYLMQHREDAAAIEAASPPEKVRRFATWLAGQGRISTDRRIYAIEGRVVVDLFLRYERLEEDLAALCDRLGLPWEPERLPEFRRIGTPDRDWRPCYDESSRAAVARAFAFELAWFGYGFDPDGPGGGWPAAWRHAPRITLKNRLRRPRYPAG